MLRCRLCLIFGHETSACNVCPKRVFPNYKRTSKNGRGAAGRLRRRKKPASSIPPPPTNTRRRRTAPPTLHQTSQIARRKRREGQWSLSANDARLWYDETPTSPLWASYMRVAKEAAREMRAPSAWKQRRPLAGNSQPFAARTNSRSTRRTARPFGGNTRCGAIVQSAARQVLRSVLQMDRTPLDMVILGLQKIAARLERKRARPLTREWVDGYPHSRTDWKQRVVFRPAWITASCRSEIAALTPNNFTLEPDGSIILDWSVASRTARADSRRALRFVRIRGQDAFDTTTLCRTLRRNESLRILRLLTWSDLWFLGMPRRTPQSRVR
ncbi:hypothetical protein TcBrA4_0046020 [Trypanosoma cruzi]|nr:hypothetical protein TcBrA4_0046020 [Trypanosoma cruzi]